MLATQNLPRIFIFTLGVLFGVSLAVTGCWLMVSRAQPKIQSVALADKKITEVRLNENTYLYNVNHSDTELAALDDGVLINQIAERTKESGMTRFVIIKIEPKQFCAAVAVHPAANVLLMRPLDEHPPEIFDLDTKPHTGKIDDEL